MHPELFELKALVAGRLDAHRRREIDDHLGSCADCSRHYVAMMLGSTSPKTAEAEAREALAPRGAGSMVAFAGTESIGAPPMYGIDAPIAPPARTAPRSTPSAPVPAEPKLVDVIATLRADSETSSAPPAKVVVPQAKAPAPVVDDFTALSTSIFTPTPADGVPLIEPISPPLGSGALLDVLSLDVGSLDGASLDIGSLDAASPFGALSSFELMPTISESEQFVLPPAALPVAPPPAATVAPAAPARSSSEKPGFMSRPPTPAATAPLPSPELVVTFSSTPPRTASHRSPASSSSVTPASDREYVSQAVTIPSSATAAFDATFTTAGAPAWQAARDRKPMVMGATFIAAAALLAMGVGGFRYFQSSVSEAAASAAAAATQKVTAEAAKALAARPGVAAAKAAPAPVQTRYVIVREPAKASTPAPQVVEGDPSTPVPSVPIAVTLPDLNMPIGGTDAAMQANTQRSATSELTRSARATASRTASPRP